MFAQVFSNFFHGIALGELACLPPGSEYGYLENPFFGDHLLKIAQTLLANDSEGHGGLARSVSAVIGEDYFENPTMRARAGEALLVRSAFYGVLFNPRPFLKDRLTPLMLPFQTKDPYAKIALAIVGNAFCEAACSVEGLLPPLDGEYVFRTIQWAARDFNVDAFPAVVAERDRVGGVFTDFIRGLRPLDDAISAISANDDPEVALLHTAFKAIMIAFVYDVADDAAAMAKTLAPGDACCASLAAAYTAVSRTRNPGQAKLTEARSIYAYCQEDDYQVDTRLEHLRLVVKPIAARKAWYSEVAEFR